MIAHLFASGLHLVYLVLMGLVMLFGNAVMFKLIVELFHRQSRPSPTTFMNIEDA